MAIGRRGFLKGAAAGLAGLGLRPGSLAQAGSVSEERPNILFFFSDDHTCQAIGAYGSRINRTPNIDRIAREGAVFENSFCTNSICAPSRAVVLTGRHSHLNGVLSNRNKRLDMSQALFPRLLQGAGYQTAIVGKWHLSIEPPGFDYWEVLPGQGSYYNPRFRAAEGGKQYTGHSTEIITDRALRWLREGRDGDRPFLLMCQYKATHRNWMPGLDYVHRYEDERIPEPDTLFDRWEENASPARNQNMTIARTMQLSWDLKVSPPLADMEKGDLPRFARGMTPEQLKAWDAAYAPRNEAFRQADPQGKDLVRWKYQRYIKDYLRCAAGIDDGVGRLLDFLDRSGLARNTVVIYCADQGFYLGEHGWFDKRWMYEESLKMPFIVRWPGVVEPGSRVKPMVQNLDYAPTFLQMAGLEPPQGMQGRSLMPLLRGEEPADWRDSIYYHYHEHGGHGVPRHYGVRTERHKLIRFYATDEWEFYDLEEDPDERHNVYGADRYSGDIRRLKEELRRLRQVYGDDTGAPMPGG